VVEGQEIACYVYTEFGSKNRQGGFNSLNRDNKIVRQYQNLSDGGVCHVQILDTYFSKLPSQAKENDVFYLTPNKLADKTKPWYSLVPVGRNRLGSMLKDMCVEARISGNFTNHSLRVYGATALYHAKVPEKLIQQRTGHQSLKALRQYERTSDSQLLEVSNIISSSSDKVQAAASRCEPCNKTKTKYVYSSNTAVTQKSDGITIPAQQFGPTIASFLKSCSFTNCNVTFTGSTTCTDESQSKFASYEAAELMENINIEEFFAD